MGGSGAWTFIGELNIDTPITITGNLNIQGSAYKYLSAKLTIADGGKLTVGGTGTWELLDGAEIENRGTLDLRGGLIMQSLIGSKVLANYGLITCNAPTGSPTSVRLEIVNNGVVRGESGHCYFTDGGGPNTGAWESMSSNAKVVFQGPSGFETWSFTGTSRFRSSNDGAVETLSGIFSVTDGQPQIQGHVLLSGGVFRTPNGAWLVADNGTVTVTAEIGIEEAQFINQGLFEVTSTQSVYFNADSVFINRAPGIMNFKSAGGFSNYIGESILRNELGATITCNAPTGSVSTIELALHNNGTVTTQSGICQLSGGADPSAGVFRADGKDLRIGGAFDLIQSATLTGINGGVIILDDATLSTSAGQTPKFTGDISFRAAELRGGNFLISEDCTFTCEGFDNKGFRNAQVENRGELLLKQGSVIVVESIIDNYANLTVTDGSLSGTNRLINHQTGRIVTDIPTGAERFLSVPIENHGVFEHRKSTLILSQFFNENDGQVVIGGGSLSAGEITLNGGVMTYESGTVNAPVHNAGGLLKIGSTADTATELRVQGYKQSTVDAQLEINVKSLNSFDKLVVEGSVEVTGGDLLIVSAVDLAPNTSLSAVLRYQRQVGIAFTGHDEFGCNEGTGFQTQAKQTQMDLFVGCDRSAVNVPLSVSTGNHLAALSTIMFFVALLLV